MLNKTMFLPRIAASNIKAVGRCGRVPKELLRWPPCPTNMCHLGEALEPSTNDRQEDGQLHSPDTIERFAQRQCQAVERGQKNAGGPNCLKCGVEGEAQL